MKIAKAHNYRGFTLVETAIAMGMVALMITAFMVAFGPAVKSINKSISAKQAERLAGALEHELSILRATEKEPVGGLADDGDARYVSAFEKAFYWIRDSSTVDTAAVLIYQYRGDPGSVRADGTLQPYTLAMAEAYKSANDGEPPSPGVQYVIQTAVRRLSNNTVVSAELAPGVLQGRVYYARMRQLIYYDTADADTDLEMVLAGENGAPGGLGQIIDPTPDGSGNRVSVTDSESYTAPPLPAPAPNGAGEGIIAFQVQFYIVPNVLYGYLSTTWSVANPGALVFTKNMAVMR